MRISLITTRSSRRKALPVKIARAESLEDRRLFSAGAVDSTFGNAGTAYAELLPGGQARYTAIAPNGKIIVGGSTAFSDFSHFALTQFNTDGSLDRFFGNKGTVITTFPGEQIASIEGIAVAADGKIDVVGTTSTDTTLSLVVARYLPNGKLDPSFGSGGLTVLPEKYTDASNSIAIQSDGKIVTAGNPGSSDAPIAFGVVRLTSSGKLDPTFGSGGHVTAPLVAEPSGGLATVLIDRHGRILVGGHGNVVARFKPNGQLDTTFGNGGSVELSDSTNIQSIVLQPDGKILLPKSSSITRLLDNGAPDPTFGDNGTATLHINLNSVEPLLVQKNGELIAVSSDRHFDLVLEELTATGKRDPSFGNGGFSVTPPTNSLEGFPSTAAVQRDGKIVVSFTNFIVRRFTSSGALDQSFGFHGQEMNPYGINGTITDVVDQPDGKIIVAGTEVPATAGLPTAAALARYNSDGTLDTSFGVDGRAFLELGASAAYRSLAIEPDGDIVAGGYGQAGGQVVFVIARYTPGGKLDPTFGSGGKVITSFGDRDGQRCAAIALQGNGDIVAAGSLYGSHGEMQWMAIARYLPGGALDPSFGIGGHVLLKPGGKVSGATSVALDSSGNLIVAGSIDYNAALVRLSCTGKLDRTFGTGGIVIHMQSISSTPVDSRYNSISITKSGSIVAAGSAYGILVARYTQDGTPDSGFGDGGILFDQNMLSAPSMVLQNDGKILVGGVDYPIGASAVIRLTTSGVFDPRFGTAGITEISPEPEPSPDSNFTYPPTTALTIQPDGKILAAAGSDLSRLMGK